MNETPVQVKMDNGVETKRRALQHLRTARGQLDGVLRMVEDDRYCVDISKQLLAIQSLLRKANLETLRGHMRTCVADAVSLNGSGGDEKVDEIFQLLDSYVK